MMRKLKSNDNYFTPIFLCPNDIKLRSYSLIEKVLQLARLFWLHVSFFLLQYPQLHCQVHIVS